MMPAFRVERDNLPSRLRRSVIFPQEDGFAAACQGFNLAKAKHPDMVVMAADAGDVASAVRLAATAGMHVSVQATGHGSGIAARNGMLINTSAMRSVAIDPVRRTARAGAGATWRDVIDAAGPHGLAPLNGSSADIGVVGFTLGGGMGPMGRTFGFAADHVLRIELVDTEGDVVEVDAVHEPELFWALRGGKCSVGIVTEIEFALMQVPDYYGGAIYFPGANARTVLHAFRTWVTTLPEQATASVALLRLPAMDTIPEHLRGKFVVHLRFVHVGDDASGAALIAPMRSVAAPMIDLVGRNPYTAIASVHQDPAGPLPAWDRSMLLRELPAEAIDAVLDVAGPDVDIPLIMVELRQLGGALSRQAEQPNAVGGRHAAFLVELIAAFPPPLQAVVPAVGAGVLKALEPWSTGGTQINFQGDMTAADQAKRAWPEPTWTRLEALKRARDPQGRFTFGYPV